MTQSLEDYLEAIGNLEKINNNPRVKDIADLLGISKPSVHMALHELENRGMIEHEHYGAITLTSAGREEYAIIKNKHETLKAFLRDALNISEECAESDACKMEHIVSEETFTRISEIVKSGKKFI